MENNDLDKPEENPEVEINEEEKTFLKPKSKRNISDEKRKELSERMKIINQQRIDKARVSKQKELDLKEQKKLDQLERIRERKLLAENVSIRESLKSREKVKETLNAVKENKKVEPKQEIKQKQKKEEKPKKKPVIVYETSSSEEDDNSDSSESSQEVILVKSKSKNTQLKPKKSHIVKESKKENISQSVPAPPKPIIRFI